MVDAQAAVASVKTRLITMMDEKLAAITAGISKCETWCSGIAMNLHPVSSDAKRRITGSGVKRVASEDEFERFEIARH